MKRCFNEKHIMNENILLIKKNVSEINSHIKDEELNIFEYKH